MLQKLLCAATMATVLWSLWIRRHTWTQCQFQIGATAMLAFSAATLVMLAPFTTATLGVLLHQLTGRYCLNHYLAHVCGIGASAAALYNAIVRLDEDEAFARKYTRRVQFPVHLFIIGLFVPFWMSHSLRQYHSSLSDMHVDWWLRSYWILLCSLYIYLLGYAAHAFLEIRHDSGSRSVAIIYLSAAVSGIVACGARIVLAIDPDAGFRDHPILVIASLLCMGGFAFGAGKSWQRRRWQFSQPNPIDLVPDPH